MPYSSNHAGVVSNATPRAATWFTGISHRAARDRPPSSPITPTDIHLISHRPGRELGGSAEALLLELRFSLSLPAHQHCGDDYGEGDQRQTAHQALNDRPMPTCPAGETSQQWFVKALTAASAR